MKVFSKFFLCALAVGMFSCASDEPLNTEGTGTPGTSEELGGSFYSTINLTVPGRNTRSGEVNEGVEVGQDWENAVGSILVVIAKEEGGKYTYLTSGVKDGSNLENIEENKKFRIRFTDLEALKSVAGEKVNVFAYCNPTEALREKIQGVYTEGTGYTGGLTKGAEFLDEECPVEDIAGTWADNAFLMTSIEMVETVMPTEEEMYASTKPTDAEPLVVGFTETAGVYTRDKTQEKQIPVIRTMSRFDFKDISENKDLSYTVKGITETDKVFGTIKLVNVALYNMRDQFYFIPRIYSTKTAKNVYCPTQAGMEINYQPETYGKSFVVSPSARTFNGLKEYPTANAINMGEGVLLDPTSRDANGFQTGNGLKWYSLNGIKNGKPDTDDGWGTALPGGMTKNDYHIWRYTTENTFPFNEDKITGFDASQMTTIVFEAEFIPDVSMNHEEGQPIFSFGDNVYGTIKAMLDQIAKQPSSDLASAFNKVFTATESEGKTTYSYDPKEAQKYGFSIYKPVQDGEGKWHYYCYYFYANKHVDDGKISETGDMEYATIRNNVYKLAVSNIQRIGSLEVEDPKKFELYFKVDVEIKPWVVRMNYIEF